MMKKIQFGQFSRKKRFIILTNRLVYKGHSFVKEANCMLEPWAPICLLV